MKLPFEAFLTASSEEKPTSWKSPELVVLSIPPPMPPPGCWAFESEEPELELELELELDVVETGWKESVSASEVVSV